MLYNPNLLSLQLWNVTNLETTCIIILINILKVADILTFGYYMT